MPVSNGIAYYVTSHGYGHMNRAAAVIAALPRSTRVVVRTARDQFDRFHESLRRPIELIEGVFDCGAVHPPGESSLVDPGATLKKYAQVHRMAQSHLDREVRFLREGEFACVVSDIAPFPLVAARRAGIPGVLVANFTWHDIMSAFVRFPSRHDRDLLRRMYSEYETATCVLRAQPAIASPTGVPVKDVGLIARRGRRRRDELRRLIGAAPQRRLVYMYVGRYGQEDMNWQGVARSQGFDFVSYHTIPNPPPHWHVVNPAEWSPADLAASVHVMVAKAGYGTVTDAMVHGTPLVFPPRHGFTEHRVLASALRRWGGGVSISTADFKNCRVQSPILRALEWRRVAAPWPVDGARRCAREIVRVAANPQRRK
jgi:UDP:flavonoid glycosyltransferase YjiC (YdhE family)